MNDAHPGTLSLRTKLLYSSGDLSARLVVAF